MNYYLQSVVPSEMPPSWSTAALQAQAVAARTYAAYEMAHQASGSSYDVCDSTSCQVYKGLAGYTSSGTLVPHENSRHHGGRQPRPAGLGVFYGGAPAFTQFGSSNGGQTVASSLAYQVSQGRPLRQRAVRQLEPVDHLAVDQQDRERVPDHRHPQGAAHRQA